MDAIKITSEFEEKIKQMIEKYARPANEIILDDVDVRDLLKVSRRTLLSYRIKEILRYHKIDNKIFYFLGEIIEDIKKF